MVAESRIDLVVDGKDQETVGALGAAWDPDRRNWFVEPGADLRPFTPWLPRDCSGHDGQVFPVADAPQGIALSEFLNRVKGVINAGLTEPVWVRAEVRKVQRAKSGHVYLELDERNEQGQSVAST